MTSPKILILLAVALFVAPAAFAQAESADLQTLLNEPQIVVADFELSKDELVSFYAARDEKPAWNFSGPENSAAFQGFLDSLQKLITYHGLPEDDYPLEGMKELAASSTDSLKLELLVTDTLLRLSHALHGDIQDLDQLYPGWNYHRADTDIPHGLADAVAKDDLTHYIESLAPKAKEYTSLAETLKVYQAIATLGPWPLIDAGGPLLPKDHGRRVAQLRSRLEGEGFLPIDVKAKDPKMTKQSDVYDDAVAKAVRDYQESNGLVPDGHVGERTLEALNIPIRQRVNQIRANMERWRHIPDDFRASRYVLVNIPDASVKIIDDGKILYAGPVIVGKVDRKTPFIQSSIHSMIFNPIWHVPTKIAQKDILPKLRKDPHYLEKLGFVIKDSENDPHGEHIDWKSMPEQEFNFRLRQSPGDMNSLGRVKFDFDNDFAVYMHGTPHQELFKKNVRNLSSGCVRLRDPLEVAEVVLSGNKEPWPLDRIQAEVDSDKTHWVAIATPLPIYILYWTVFVSEDGKANFRNDIYDYDSFLMENMSTESNSAKATPAVPAVQEPAEPLDSAGH